MAQCYGRFCMSACGLLWPAFRYQCPVLNKEFTEHTHIVAIRPTGNVYCWEVRCSADGMTSAMSSVYIIVGIPRY